MAFKSTHFWNAEISLTPTGYQARNVSLRNVDPTSMASTLRLLADQIERECQLRYGPERAHEVPLLEVV